MIKKNIAQIKQTFIIHKKKILAVSVAGILLFTVAAGAWSMFHVRGVVTGVDKNSITVANFFRTQKVDLAQSPADFDRIKPGDIVKIQKNIQGNVLYIKVKDYSRHQHKNI